MDKIADILKRHGFGFDKRLGQNFLTDSNLLAAIADDAGVTAEDTVLEIGAGAGTLTRALADRAKRVVALEVDEHLRSVLAETLADKGNVKVVFKDFRSVGDEELRALVGDAFKVVANLPYYITTPIVMRFVEGDVRPVSMSVMVQKEVADRLAAAPGTADYGAITASVALCCDVRITRFVPRSLFTPPPNVDSSVVRLDFVDKLPREEEQKTRRLIGAAFAMRRKTLVNNLARCGYAKEAVAAALEKMGLRADVRGETLSYFDFAKLKNLLSV